jgi:septum formation protein
MAPQRYAVMQEPNTDHRTPIPVDGCRGTPESPPRLVLGSASLRRQKILRGLGVAFEVLVPDAGEVLHENDPARTARENARRKLRWCRARRPHCAIVAADTVIDAAGRCIGKPANLDEARRFLRHASGRSHDVLTAVVCAMPGARAATRLVRSTVAFRLLSDRDIDAYFSRVDPLDKAGAYDIDQSGERIILSFRGSRTNIMGLPEETVRDWLATQGYCVRRKRPC